MNQELAQAIASEVQLFHTIDHKENFLFLLKALLAIDELPYMLAVRY
ncbi:hypothetical protein [Nostoc sp.]